MGAGGFATLAHASIVLAEPTGRYLTFEEREGIAQMRVEGGGVRQIVRALQRNPRTISHELRRNAATRSGTREYRATVAQWKAQHSAERPKVAKLVDDVRLREYIRQDLTAPSGALTGRSCRARKRPG